MPVENLTTIRFSDRVMSILKMKYELPRVLLREWECLVGIRLVCIEYRIGKYLLKLKHLIREEPPMELRLQAHTHVRIYQINKYKVWNNATVTTWIVIVISAEMGWSLHDMGVSNYTGLIWVLLFIPFWTSKTFTITSVGIRWQPIRQGLDRYLNIWMDYWWCLVLYNR